MHGCNEVDVPGCGYVMCWRVYEIDVYLLLVTIATDCQARVSSLLATAMRCCCLCRTGNGRDADGREEMMMLQLDY